jgi:hypothetical protein
MKIFSDYQMGAKIYTKLVKIMKLEQNNCTSKNVTVNLLQWTPTDKGLSHIACQA